MSSRNLRVLPVLFLSMFAPVYTDAHELIPKVVQDFLATHPNASPEELRAVLEANAAPDLVRQIRDAEDVLRLAQQRTTLFDNSLDFGTLGLRHILSGRDHVLFVLSLLLGTLVLREVLRLTTTFTVAHSLTLLLAGAGILTLSSRVVEPVIAFSIAYVALTSAFLRRWRWFQNGTAHVVTVFVFGLFHGLGFAGILRHIQVPEDKFLSSLFSFNVGIELGQLLVVALALPVLWYIQRQPWYSLFLKIAGVSLGGVGIVWGIQRIFV